MSRFCILASYVLPTGRFFVMVTVSQSKGSTVFCKLEVHALKLSQISRNRTHSVIGRDIDQVTRATKTESVTSGTSTAVPQRRGRGGGGDP